MSGNGSYSLRRRLVWLVVGVVAAIWIASAWVVYQRAHQEADALLDNQLRQLSETLLAIVAGGEVDHFVQELNEHADRHPVPIAFEIWRLDHGAAQRLTTSPGHEGFATVSARGFSEHPHQGKRWRFYATEDDDAEYRVVVGQAHAAREQLAREIGLSMLLPALLALPMMALGVWLVVGRTLRPVEAVARQVGALDPRALTPLAEQSSLPQEIAPLRSALNTLIRRIHDAFENERRFSADAAHELRTPLAALKIQAQVAQRAQPGEGQQRALANVVTGVDRMTHLVEQLLTLARVDPALRAQPATPLDPGPLIAALRAELLPAAQRRRQSIELELVPDCAVTIAPAWFQIALRNLVDNALRYSDDGARVVIRLMAEHGRCSVTVADDGPGVAAEMRNRLTARFTRGETEEEGCGLGLSIVARIADLSGARLELGEGLARQDGGHGLSVTLHFAQARRDFA